MTMTIEDFMGLPAPERYDFSNDGASEEYQTLDQDVYEKFFTYMAMGHRFPIKNNILESGAAYRDKKKLANIKVKDPDSGSKLLQKIYALLWEELNLQHCQIKGNITGDTMNSANTTLNVLYECCIEKSEDKKERRKLRQNVSIRYVLSRYAQEEQEHTQKFDEIEGMKFFTSIYHTLGNFIPVPVGCNEPRGKGILEDYWDLTLEVIHGYYLGDASPSGDHIKDIVSEDEKKIKDYKDWLDSFGSWDCFVEKNFLQEFVNDGGEPGKYGGPKELWEGHFKGKVKPEKKEQIEHFYVNASSWIMARGVRMMNRLRKIIAEQKAN